MPRLVFFYIGAPRTVPVWKVSIYCLAIDPLGLHRSGLVFKRLGVDQLQ